MTNYHECSRMVSTAGGDVLPIEGVGGILLRFLSDSVAFDIQLFNVAFVPPTNPHAPGRCIDVEFCRF